MRNLFCGMLLDLFYPRRCPVCDKAVKPFGNLICGECESKIKYVGRPVVKNAAKN